MSTNDERGYWATLILLSRHRVERRLSILSCIQDKGLRCRIRSIAQGKSQTHLPARKTPRHPRRCPSQRVWSRSPRLSDGCDQDRVTRSYAGPADVGTGTIPNFYPDHVTTVD